MHSKRVLVTLTVSGSADHEWILVRRKNLVSALRSSI
jgi:hypothetical protein